MVVRGHHGPPWSERRRSVSKGLTAVMPVRASGSGARGQDWVRVGTGTRCA
ncbi:hypothetical protein CZ771_11140 [Actinomycetales bacterium JB111]|nr:hypothetical protein CZ771_11140 [Actinomycetales bacterium JB111]